LLKVLEVGVKEVGYNSKTYTYIVARPKHIVNTLTHTPSPVCSSSQNWIKKKNGLSVLYFKSFFVNFIVASAAICCKHTHKHTHTHRQTKTQTHIHTHTQDTTNIYKLELAHRRILFEHTYTHTHIHTHTHTYTHKLLGYSDAKRRSNHLFQSLCISKFRLHCT